MFSRALFASAVLASLFTACGPVGDCARDTDCKDDRVCQGGVCTGPSNLTGAGGGSSAGGGTASGGGGGSSSTGGTCCLNGAFYGCASKAAFDRCAGFDVGACHANCAPSDFNCQINCDNQAATSTHDPSQCTRDSSRDTTCTITPSDTCSNSHTEACSYSTQCASGNCTDGYCRGNGLGAHCGYSTQCTSGNCTDGCCRGNSTGSKCDYSTQCTSGNCTNGHCQ